VYADIHNRGPERSCRVCLRLAQPSVTFQGVDLEAALTQVVTAVLSYVPSAELVRSMVSEQSLHTALLMPGAFASSWSGWCPHACRLHRGSNLTDAAAVVGPGFLRANDAGSAPSVQLPPMGSALSILVSVLLTSAPSAAPQDVGDTADVPSGLA